LTRDTATPIPGTRFIDPEVLTRLSSVELVAKTVVSGFISGLHHAPYLGLSTDFAEHRAYNPGDDVRRIDWRVYGRTDRLFVREFQAETNANLTLVLDVSKSMGFQSGGISKLDYGRFLAASLGYLSLQQRDRVGLITFDEDLVSLVPPSVKHFDRVLHELDTATPARAGGFEKPLATIARTLGRRGIVALISDLYVEPKVLLDSLTELRYRGHDVLVFHILDPAEVALPEAETRQFEDMESGARLSVVHAQMRESYDNAIHAHMETLHRQLGEQRMDYRFFDTSTPLDHALFEYLSERQHRVQVR
ncbi:MAG: DUF58 domain-containing protein, partial [Gammaproteobacteria bacterium]|nr:DUF58 domain-containing protein [Gammaproteobacteria bacterium]